mmetsp:Transcript_83231/g.231665  ORF Transcript_83231/g.231665 Transcript_83231/m.231665 type:complete len:211 (-) Transcript_83231:51-683(-)
MMQLSNNKGANSYTFSAEGSASVAGTLPAGITATRPKKEPRTTRQAGERTSTQLKASRRLPERSTPMATMRLASNTCPEAWITNPAKEKWSSPRTVNKAANIAKAMTCTCHHAKRSRAAMSENTYTKTRLVSFIICRKATERWLYARFAHTKVAAKANPMGTTPRRMKRRSMFTFLAGCVSAGNSDGAMPSRTAAEVLQKAMCMAARGAA